MISIKIKVMKEKQNIRSVLAVTVLGRILAGIEWGFLVAVIAIACALTSYYFDTTFDLDQRAFLCLVFLGFWLGSGIGYRNAQKSIVLWKLFRLTDVRLGKYRNARAAIINQQMAEKQKRIDQLSKEIDKLKDELQELGTQT